MIADINKEDLEEDIQIKVLKQVRQAGLNRADSKLIDKAIMKSTEQITKSQKRINDEYEGESKDPHNDDVQEQFGLEEEKRAKSHNGNAPNSDEPPEHDGVPKLNFLKILGAKANSIIKKAVEDKRNDEIDESIIQRQSILPDNETHFLDIKKTRSHNPKMHPQNELDLDEINMSKQQINNDQLHFTSVKRRVSGRTEINKLSLSKYNRQVSQLPYMRAVPEKKTVRDGAMTLAPKSTKTINLIRMVTNRAIKNVSERPEQDDQNLKQPSNNINLFQKSFQKFKRKVADNINDFQKLKPETKTKINNVIKIEQSIKFRLTRHIMNRMDIFSRFFFPIIFTLWFNFSLFFLDYNYPRFVILNMLTISTLVCK